MRRTVSVCHDSVHNAVLQELAQLTSKDFRADATCDALKCSSITAFTS